MAPAWSDGHVSRLITEHTTWPMCSRWLLPVYGFLIVTVNGS
jgi:hypothetical protein